MDKDVIKSIVNSPTLKADDTGGITENDNKFWFVAIVNNHSEKKYSELIQKLGHEVFVPTQKEERIWKNGKTKTIDRILISATIFVKCTEEERINILKHQYAKRFMVDHTKTKENGRHPIAIVPNNQIESFRKFIEQYDNPIEIVPIPYKLGESVKITKGKLKGLIGNVIQYTEGKAHIVICLGCLGCANLKINTNLIVRV